MVNVGGIPAWIEGADHRIMARDESSDLIFLVDITLLGVELRMRR
jgi:hypothetical protein